VITHVQNPWTRSPQLFVHMTVEEVQQAHRGLQMLLAQNEIDLAQGRRSAIMDHNQESVLKDLLRTLDHALQTPRPHGIKGTMP
jgi:hypothetical protein